MMKTDNYEEDLIDALDRHWNAFIEAIEKAHYQYELKYASDDYDEDFLRFSIKFFEPGKPREKPTEIKIQFNDFEDTNKYREYLEGLAHQYDSILRRYIDDASFRVSNRLKYLYTKFDEVSSLRNRIFQNKDPDLFYMREFEKNRIENRERGYSIIDDLRDFGEDIYRVLPEYLKAQYKALAYIENVMNTSVRFAPGRLTYSEPKNDGEKLTFSLSRAELVVLFSALKNNGIVDIKTSYLLAKFMERNFQYNDGQPLKSIENAISQYGSAGKSTETARESLKSKFKNLF